MPQKIKHNRTAMLLIITASLLFIYLPTTAQPATKHPARLQPADEAFLEDLSRRSFLFFWEQSDPATGLTLDRARADGSPHHENRRHIASIASTGFGLTALCIAAERRWIDPKQARERV